MSKMTAIEKVQKIKEALNSKKYSSVVDACKVFKLSPASYYNYSKKIGKAPKTTKTQNPSTVMTKNEWVDELQALKLENSLLKKKAESDNMLVHKLKTKLLDFVLQ